ncbi:MFS transporter [Chloroflexota bacterium]
MRTRKVFYGYWILAALFFCLFILGGCGIYSFSLFVRPLQDEFGWGRGEIMMAYTLFFLSMGGTAPLIGRLVIRYEARKVIAIGASIGGLGFILLTLMQNLGHFYASYIVIAVGLSASGMVPATTVISNWFNKRRGIAIGIVTAGIPAGGITLARVIGGYSIPNFGWETSYLVLALITLVIVPIVLIVIKTRPAEIGLYSDGASELELVSEVNIPLTSEGINLKKASTTSTFWLMVASFVIYGFVSDGVFQHQVPYLQDIGFPVATAAANLSVWGLGGLSGRLFFGWLCDQIQAKYVLCISLGLKLVAIIVLMNLTPTSPQLILWIYAILMGASMGATVTTSSMLVSKNFGLSSYSIIFGTVSLATSIGSATGPLFLGYMYDNMTTYHLAFIILLVLSTAAIPIALAIRRPTLSSIIKV